MEQSQSQRQAWPSSSAGGGKAQDSGVLTREDFDGGPVSIDEVDTGLFLGKHIALILVIDAFLNPSLHHQAT